MLEYLTKAMIVGALLFAGAWLSSARASEDPSAHVRVILNSISCTPSQTTTALQPSYSSRHQYGKIIIYAQCVNIGPAESIGVSDSSPPPCERVEPSTGKVVAFTLGAAGVIEVIVPELKVARPLIAVAKHKAAEAIGEYLADHIPPQTVARCVTPNMHVPYPWERISAKWAYVAVKDDISHSWSPCPLRGPCSIGALWVDIPSPESPIFQCGTTLDVRGLPNEMPHTHALVRNWAAKSRQVLIVMGFEVDESS
jgi:hypothetical protein